MRNFENQLEVSDDFVEFLDFIEIHCSAACCGLEAFELSEGLLLRFLLDKKDDRKSWYKSTVFEIAELEEYLGKKKITDSELDIPFVYPRNDSLPEYYLPHNEVTLLLKRLKGIFENVVGSNVLPNAN